jgi:mRNA interferase MazF
MHVRRGEVFWVSFDSSTGGEISKTRPAVIVSNNVANEILNRVIVVPLTSNTEKIYPGETRVSAAGKVHKALANQLRTVSKLRVGDRFGALSANDLSRVETIMLLQLGIRIRGRQP